jgi:patatin-like phospholipase/acyl hydrolase
MTKIESEVAQKSPRFQILSLDGGGIRGVFSAATLAAIEADLNVSIADHFDLITGTSTGGIIALALGLGLSPKEILKFYTEKGPQIFSNRLGWRGLLHWVMRKYPDSDIEASLKDCFSEKLLGHSTKRLVISSYNIDSNDVYLFRTPHHESLRRDYKVQAWKIARATSAAPTFFPPYRGIDSIRLVDGGVWANNPTLIGIVEAQRFLNIKAEDIWVLSLGTGQDAYSSPTRLNWGGKLLWASQAVDVIMRGQSIAVHNHAQLLLGKERVERVNPYAPTGNLSLDGLPEIDILISRAAVFSRQVMPSLADKFFIHKARPYAPLYQDKPK